MKRHALLSVATVAALTLASAESHAQSMPPAQPMDPAQPAQPAQPMQQAPIAQGMVRMHFHMFRGKKSARVYVQKADGAVSLVCQTPCTADVPVGTQMRVTVGDNDEPHLFSVPGDMGQEVDIEVKGPAVGALVGGIVMLASGGATLISGLVLIAISDTGSGLFRYGDYRTAGYVCIGLGAGVAVGGLILLLNRSQEPRVQGDPHRPGTNYYYGREETFLADTASAKPRDPTTAIPPPAVAPILSFAF